MCFLLWFVLTITKVSPQTYSDPICIESTIKPLINGKYEYHSWNVTLNGSIYLNSESNIYLYPWLLSSGNIRYLIHYDPTTSLTYSLCDIPSNLNQISPYNCHNDNGQQLKSYVSKWVDDTTATIMPCRG